MRRIAVINQKGGVGKTTTCANLGAALARAGQRVVLVDMDPQANLSLHLGAELGPDEASIYSVLLGSTPFAEALRPTNTEGLSLVASHLDLSGAELELAAAIGRESLLRDALRVWEETLDAAGAPGADYLILDCPPSLGLLSVNVLAAVQEILITLQTEFFALQGMSKLVEVVQLMRRRLNPQLEITGILPCLYDSRLRLAREVLGEIRRYFPARVLPRPIRSNVKLAESPSFGQTIFEYAPSSAGAEDYRRLAEHILAAAPGEAGGPIGSAIPSSEAAKSPSPKTTGAHTATDGVLTPMPPPVGASKRRIVRASDLPALDAEVFGAEGRS
jgi:chromosome partitioning protein